MIISGMMVCVGFFLLASDKLVVVLAGLGLIIAAAYKDGAFMQFEDTESIKRRRKKRRKVYGTYDRYKS